MGPIYMDTHPLIKECLEKLETTDKQKQLIMKKLGIPFTTEKEPHVFITIQFTPDLFQNIINDREKVENVMLPLLNFKWFKSNDFIYIFEFFSEKYPGPDILNPHVHILLRPTHTRLNKSKIIRDITKKLGPLLKVVNYLNSNSSEHYCSRVNYLKGTKKTDKCQYQILDEKAREKYNLRPYYNA